MTHILSTIVVDDEPLARKGLMIRLQQHKDINIVADCANGREAIEAVKNLKPDLMFIDIKMPGLNGFEVVTELLSSVEKMPLVIFVTAFEEYALQAFEIHAQDYLLKPADEDRIQSALERVRSQISNQESNEQKMKLVKLVSDVTGNNSSDILVAIENNRPVNLNQYSDILAIKDAGEVSRVPTKDILWIDAAGDYMCVHTDSETHILRKTMKQLEESLDPRVFIRSHRSTIVNKNYIRKFCSQMNGEYYLVMSNNKELKVSRSYKDKVKQTVNA
jgi:two-component system LytT family response regulator